MRCCYCAINDFVMTFVCGYEICLIGKSLMEFYNRLIFITSIKDSLLLLASKLPEVH